jgi:hypothetical protein
MKEILAAPALHHKFVKGLATLPGQLKSSSTALVSSARSLTGT